MGCMNSMRRLTDCKSKISNEIQWWLPQPQVSVTFHVLKYMINWVVHDSKHCKWAWDKCSSSDSQKPRHTVNIVSGNTFYCIGLIILANRELILYGYVAPARYIRQHPFTAPATTLAHVNSIHCAWLAWM